MKKHETIGLFFIVVAVLFAPSVGNADNSGPPAAAVKLEDKPGDFDGDMEEAGAKIREAMRLLHRNGFYRNLFAMIDKGDISRAEQLLREKEQNTPESAQEASFRAAKSQIDFAKGDYKAAYAGADRIVTDIEKTFAPLKPYEIDFKNREIKSGIYGAYILRYQAAAFLGRYKEALVDLNHALQMIETAGGLMAKTGVLAALGRYKEAAAACVRTCEVDKSVFLSSYKKDYYLDIFKSHGENIAGCE